MLPTATAWLLLIPSRRDSIPPQRPQQDKCRTSSVSRYAASHASCPVAVVRDESPSRQHLVGVGLGDLDDCARTLAFALEEATLRKAALMTVHAWHAPQPDISRAGESFTAPDLQHVEAKARRQFEELFASWREKYPDVVVHTDVVHSHPARAPAGLSTRTDLVVIGRHSKHSDLPGLGVVRHPVLNHAHGPVAIVPSGT